MADSPTWGGWDADVRDDPFPHFAEARARCPVQQVRLADGHDAWVVLGYDAARQALNEPRISKDMLAALEGDPDVVAEGLPGPAFSRHMLNVAPPPTTRACDDWWRAPSSRPAWPRSSPRSDRWPMACSTS